MKRIISLLLCALMLLSVCSVAVSADETEWGLPFTDLVEGAWYMEGIEYCYSYGIVAGMTETTFEPNGTLTRAQFVQILAMYDMADLSIYNGLSCGFEDVKPSHWYSNAVCWAYSKGYVAGVSETRFAPNAPITREQFARILYVYAESWDADVSYRADLSAFEDESKVSSWAYEQIQWAVAIGIISGVSETELAPRNNATRAQACRMIMTFDDYFSTGYLKNDTYYALVDYIRANGTVSELDPAVIEIIEETEDGTCTFYYDSDFDVMIFEYYSGEFEVTDEYGDTYTDYARYGSVSLSDIYESYSLNLWLSDTTPDNYYTYTGIIYPKGEVPFLEDYYGFPEEYNAYHCDIIRTQLNAFMMKHIAAAGIAFEDMFAYYEYNTGGNFRTVADYIIANGTEGSYGEYTVTVSVDGKEFYAEYNPVSDELDFYFGNITETADSYGYVWMYELSDAYSFSYVYENYETDDYLMAARYVYADGDEVWLSEYTMDEETAYAMEAEAYAFFCEGFAQVLAGCGLEMSDMLVTVE